LREGQVSLLAKHTWEQENERPMEKKTTERAVEALLKAAPGSKVILFGSQARGDAARDSDLDFLVVEPGLRDRLGEMVRLCTVLGQMLIPADVMVVSEDEFEKWRDTPNTLIYRARREGKIYEQVA
jgi:predicted nucleotidyltransferase